MKYYVYVHTDPKTKEIVYIGKGCGGRAWDVTRCRGQHKEHQKWMNSLIEEGFVPSDWVEVRHKNLEEKEAYTIETQLIHKTGLTRFNRQSGERQHQSKMTNEQAIKAFQLRDEGLSHKQIAEIYGVSRSAISMLLSGKQWKTITRSILNIDQSI